MNTDNEAVMLSGLVSAAISATVGLLALVFSWSKELSASILAVSGTWTLVILFFVGRANVYSKNTMKALAQLNNKPKE